MLRENGMLTVVLTLFGILFGNGVVWKVKELVDSCQDPTDPDRKRATDIVILVLLSIAVLLITVLIVVELLPDPQSTAGNYGGFGFSDVEAGDWCFDAVKYLFDRDLIVGVGENQFVPEKPATRAMVTAVIYRMAGEPASKDDVDFTDVQGDEYYRNAVAWAASYEIVMGNDDNGFDPEADITREQIASILYRYHVVYKGRQATSAGSKLLMLMYSDRQAVSEYAVSGVAWAINSGLFRDIIDDNAILPKHTVSRAEAAVIFARYLKKY